MHEWLLFWKYLCGIGVLIYVVTLVIIIPLGGRDILRLFSILRKRHYHNAQKTDDFKEKQE